MQAQWTVLGSGAGTAMADRVSPGHLLETPAANILFDCGDGVTGSFLRAGKRPEDVDAICVSHLHPDHVCGLTFFLQQMYLVNRRRELTIHFPGEAIAGFKSYLSLSYLFLDRFPFAIVFHPLGDGEVISCGDVRITPRLNSHLTKHRGQPWMANVDNRGESYSFEIRHDTKNIVYSADIGSLDDLRFCGNADVVLVEVTHVDLRELLTAAETWNLKTVILTHIGPEFSPENLADARQYFSGTLLTATDGLAVPLT